MMWVGREDANGGASFAVEFAQESHDIDWRVGVGLCSRDAVYHG